MSNENYYINNDLLIQLECQRTGSTLDLTDSSIRRIYYKKPDNVTGYWSASLSGTHILYYNATSTNDRDGNPIFDINQSGVWKLKAYVKYNSGAIYQGDVVELVINKAWQIQ